MDPEDPQSQLPLIGLSKTSSQDKDASEAKVIVQSATTDEAPFGTQMFWLGVWMLK